jgi:hypothetical protein
MNKMPQSDETYPQDQLRNKLAYISIVKNIIIELSLTTKVTDFLCHLLDLLLYLLDASRVRHKSLQQHPAKKTTVSPPQITHSDLNLVKRTMSS